MFAKWESVAQASWKRASTLTLTLTQKQKATLINYASNDYIKQVVQKLNCKYDKGYTKLEEKIIDDNLDATLERMLQSIRNNI
jgi:hypothetical protein